MPAGKFRLKRAAAKELLTVLGVLAVVTLVVYSLPELDSELSRSDLINIVFAGGAVFVVVRLIIWLVRKNGSHRRRRGRERTRRQGAKRDLSS